MMSTFRASDQRRSGLWRRWRFSSAFAGSSKLQQGDVDVSPLWPGVRCQKFSMMKKGEDNPDVLSLQMGLHDDVRQTPAVSFNPRHPSGKRHLNDAADLTSLIVVLFWRRRCFLSVYYLSLSLLETYWFPLTMLTTKTVSCCIQKKLREEVVRL